MTMNEEVPAHDEAAGRASGPAHDHDAVAHLLRALADPNRLALVHLLAEGERRVVDLTAALGLAQSTVSAHLVMLRDVGVVAVRREGRASWYRLVRPEVAHLLADAERVVDAAAGAP
ncbi:ArsR/SmtB family transcription factor [Oerskovia flava]|uniref:ArsR/SmtB family transcription factor n=1 Tax=Oerskovia flava TaxID=2986422 RepID=UPI00223F925F|nr:metalloregulator ArsR/SmtB family transcription factor [Oerskovia sp. JB1-3-2]